MANIDTTEATNLLNASLVTGQTYTKPPGWFLAYGSTAVVPTGTTLATELAGTTRQAIAFPTASAGSTTAPAVSHTSMPAGTVRYVEIYSTSTGTTRRLWYGQLSADKTTASGDTLTVTVTATLS
jgi:hypothetical protein